MTIIYATDIHLTDKQPINRVTPVVPSSIHAFRKLISAATDGYLVLGGDLFDSPCPSYDLFNTVVKELQKKQNCDVYAIPGNHDILYGNYAAENTALSALVNMGLVTLLGTDPVKIDEYFVFGVPYQKEIYTNFESVGIKIPNETAQKTIIVTHQYISNKKLPFNHVSITDFDAQNVGIVLCGHWHEEFDVIEKNTHFINPGCITKLSRNEALFKTSYIKIEKYDKIERVFLEEETNIEFIQKQVSATDFIKSINEAKIEKQDIFSYIKNSSETEEVKAEAIKLIKEYENT